MAWLPSTPTKSVRQVSIYHSMWNLQEREYVEEFLSVLSWQCAQCYCEQSISTRQNAGGQVVTTVLTELGPEQVSASHANVAQKFQDCTTVVVSAIQTQHGSISAAMNTPSDSRA